MPVPHFGVVLPMDAWEALAKKLTDAGTEFVIKPYVRFKGEVGEQATMFFMDPRATRWSSRPSRTWTRCSPSDLPWQ